MKKKNKAIYLLFLMPFVYFATACFVVWLVKTSGIYPSGSDTMYHVYRGDYVYNAINRATGILYMILHGITAWRF